MRIASRYRGRHRAARRKAPVALLSVAALLVAGVWVGTSSALASQVSSVNFAPGTTSAGATSGPTSPWTVQFTTTTPLPAPSGNNKPTVSITFAAGFGVSGAAVALAAGFNTKCSATTGVSGQTVTATIAGGNCPGASGTLTVSVTNVVNPTTATTYPAANFTVATSADTTSRSASSAVTITAAAPSQLTFTGQPSGGVAATAWAGQPVVTVQDQYGNTVTGESSRPVNLAIAEGTPASGGPGTLSGCSQSETAGVVTFAGCQIDKVGAGYRLTAQSGTLAAATSNTFGITLGAPAKLAFSTPPSSGTAGSAIADFVVAVQDAGGNTITSGTGASDSITLIIASGPVGGSFNGGSTTVPASNGSATFTGITFNTVGSYTLTAGDSRSGVSPVTSGAIAINAAAARSLAFVQQPADAFAGTPMTPAVTVQASDQFGNPASSGVVVTLAPSSGVINSGATATTDASGIATFTGLTIDHTGLGLSLTASAPGVTAATSGAFNVTVEVTSGSATLTDTAADAGSGVNSISYYYCTGYSGSCPNGTLIGASSNSAGNFPVTWTNQPVSGAYRVVAVGTDNVDNVSAATAAIPVTINN